MTEIKLKPGKNSTEFIGKVVLQAILGINVLLQLLKVPSIDVSPEMTVSIVAGIEGVWMIFRQWNKKKELEMQQKVMSTDVADKLAEAIQSANGLQATQMKFETDLTKTRLQLEVLNKKLDQPGM